MGNKVLIIGHHFPEPNSSAAGSRMLQLIRLFQEQHYEIVFACASSKNSNAYNLNNLGIEEVTIQLNSTSFDDFIKQLQPHIVLFDRFITEEQFGWRVAKHYPEALRILDTEDLHGLRKGRELALKQQQDLNKSYLYNDTSKREIASMYRCDLSLIISEAECALLKNDFKVPETLFYYLPFLLDPVSSETISKLPSYNNRSHFMTIGNFLHAPNVDGVQYLKIVIWPKIRKQLPKAEMHVFGAYPSQKITQLHNKNDGFLIHGFAQNVNEVMQEYKVCLAPLRFGAGLKGKLIDAMQNGTPCVMTHIAAEGMFGTQHPNGFVTDQPEAYARYAVDLYTNEAQWNTYQNNGFKIIETRFNYMPLKNDFFNTLSLYLDKKDQFRTNNFTGQMLQHQSMQASKYMSKWIEEKNKVSHN